MKIKSSRGITLIELIVVLAIIGIVLKLAAPSFNAYRQNTNLKEAARDISSDISYYKQRAVSEYKYYKINFSAAANTYAIQQGTIIVVSPLTINYVALTTKTVGAGNANIVISGTPSFTGNPGNSGESNGTYVTLSPRGTSGAGSLTLQHTRRLSPLGVPSTATITTNLMGRVNVQYNLQ